MVLRNVAKTFSLEQQRVEINLIAADLHSLSQVAETDPIFGASPAASITAQQITNWDLAYTWGDHSTVGYLTSFTETDPIFIASPAANITQQHITNWDSAYNWGDHANAGYLTSNAIVVADIAPASPASGDLWWNSSLGVLKIYYQDVDTSQWVDASPTASSAQGAKVITSDLPPMNPVQGDLWWDSSDGSLKVYYQDVDTSQWVDASPGISFGGGGSSSSYTDADVDTHLNVSSASAGKILSWNGSDYAWVADQTGGSSYTNSDVDTHLNRSTAMPGQILSWNGSDYGWIAQSGGGGTNLTDFSVTTNSVGTAALSYDNISGVFTYTPPDLTSFATTTALNNAVSNSGNWDTAYAWGNHASAGYLTAEVDTLDSVTGRGNTTINNISVGQLTAGGLTYPNTNGTSGQVLTSDGTGNVIWSTVSGSGGGISLTDLSASTAAASGTSSLTYNNLTGDFTYTPPDLSAFATNLGGLADVDLSTSPQIGQVLKYDGTNWVAAADGTGGGGIALTDLSVTTAAAGTAALSYNNVSGVFTYTPPDLSGYSTFSGSYNDLTDKPTIPTNTSDLNNDSGFITSTQTINNLNLPDASGGFTTGQGYVTFGGSTDFYLYYSATDDRAKITSDNKLDIRGSEIYLWDGTNTHLQATSNSVTINHTGNSIRFGTLDDGSILYGDVTVTGTIEIGQTNPVIVGRGNGQVVSNTAFGVSALNANTATGTENTALGSFTLTANTTGVRNTGVSTYALGSNTLGSNNTTLGYATAYTNVAGSKLTAIGAFSQRFADSTDTATDKTNVSVGYNSLRGSATAANNTGNGNTAIGTYALESNTIGSNNTALGLGCLAQNTEANYNIGVGYYALNNATTGGGNIAVGRQALFDLVDGDTNTAVGFRAAPKITSGTGNIAIGYDSLYENTSGNTNIAIGYECLQTATTVSNNIAIGTQSLQNVTCQYNVAVGPYALRDLVGTGEANLDDGFNTAIGYAAASTTANVKHNTFLGAYAGQFGWSGLVQTTNPNWNNVTALGYNSNCSGNDQVQLGGNYTDIYAWSAVNNRSDARDKTDIRDTLLGLDFIKSLRPVDFRWDIRDDYFDFDPETNERTAVTKDGSRKRNRFHHGLIAQEVKLASDTLGVDFAGYQDHKVNGGGDVLTIGYTELIAPMIKAMQELAAENAQLKARLDAAGL